MNMKPKIALVVDALPGLGGAEKVLMAVSEMLPEAPVYTLVYNRRAFAGTVLAKRQVRTSFIEGMPFVRSQYRKYLPLMPQAIRRFDLSSFEVVVSFSYAVAHGARTTPGQLHLSYTYTPMRYAWRGFQMDGTRGSTNRLLEGVFKAFRRWDLESVSGVDRFAAVSGWIGDWISRAYRRDAEVIYPPVEVERFRPQAEREAYFITVSRLVPHKRVELIIEAFNRLKLPLVVIGDGPEYRRLSRMAGQNVRMLGFQDDRSVAELLGRARGYVCAAEEDFGIAMVEAQAAGCPVIAYGRGGALEILSENQSGIFFDEQSVESLAQAVREFEARARCFDAELLAASAQRFGRQRFQEEFAGFLAEGYPLRAVAPIRPVEALLRQDPRTS
jgi:glycosyltransferase involved in cell wall biosynthesis